MNPLDWLLAIILAYSVIRAAMRGFFREAFAFAGLAIGFILACWNFRNLAVQLRGLVSSPPLSELLAFILILAACLVIATLLGKLLSKTASAVGLSFLDRLAGAGFGFARGTLIGLAILLMLTAFLPTSPWVQTSFLAPYFLRANHAVSFVMPYDLQLRLSGALEHIRNTTVFKNKNMF
jgi:membrane protein required for colicin V production